MECAAGEVDGSEVLNPMGGGGGGGGGSRSTLCHTSYSLPHFEPNEFALVLCTTGDITQPTSLSTGGFELYFVFCFGGY